MNNDSIWNKLNFKNDDVIIASTIKSGTTWLQQIVAQIIFKGDFKGTLNQTSFWIDTVRDYSEEEMITKINNQLHRRFYKTHSPASVVLTNNSMKAKFIFITRDFRDVVWSFYNHFVNSKYKYKLLENYDKNTITRQLRDSKTPYEFWNIIIDNKHLFEKHRSYKIIWSYFNTINTWSEVSKLENVLILHFNDFKQNLKRNIESISNFLGYNYSNEILNNIYNKCTFEYMKLNSLKCTPIEFKNSNTFINKGTNKRWKDILNENDINNYNELMSLFFDSDTVYWVENGNS